ncbi:MAG: DUF4402 domain-containing protein [Novosphingobium sp.]|uniref:DUF4402 domain-containing protein n=1 Tax=Novosphingobium sp. TaxID=1874826 RepID=UPI003C7C4859
MNLGVTSKTGRIRAAMRAFFALLALTLFPAHAQAKERVTVSANARAVIVANLSFFRVDDLDFGKIVAGTTAGTVVVSPTGTRTASGGVRLASSTTVKAAKFAGKGSFNQTLTIAVTSNTVTLNRVGGGDTMTMDTFIIGSTPAIQLTTTPKSFRIATTSGIFQFPVGATLRVKARQTPGTYTGTFTISLQYQ